MFQRDFSVGKPCMTNGQFHMWRTLATRGMILDTVLPDRSILLPDPFKYLRLPNWLPSFVNTSDYTR